MSSLYLKSPLSIELTLTRKCNHKCVHCYNPWRNEEQVEKNIITKRQIDFIVNELKQNDVWHVTISGGEPLIESEKMFYLIEQLNKADITYSINTNLTLMDNNKADILLKKYNHKTLFLTSLPSSIPKICDKITQIDGSFDRIIHGINVCKSHGCKVGINMVMTKINIDNLDHLYKFLKEYKIDYLSISLVIPPSYDINNNNYYLTENDIIKMANSLIKFHDELGIDVDSVTPIPLCVLKDINKYKSIFSTSCSAGISRCNIDCVGNVFACSHEVKPYGNIFDLGLKKIWDNMTKWRNFENLNEECRQCKYVSICGGECRMMTACLGKQKYKLEKDAIECGFNNDVVINIDYDQKFILNKNIKIRTEEFGAVIRIGYDDYFLSSLMFELYKHLTKIEIFSINDLKNIVVIDSNFLEVFYYFIEIGLILLK